MKSTPHLLNNAKALRKNMTPQERKLWYLFLRSYPVKFYKQRIIGSFIVDFYCAAANLVVELDGTQHYTEEHPLADNERDAILSKQGINVLRFSNREVNCSFDRVCAAIHNEITERMSNRF